MFRDFVKGFGIKTPKDWMMFALGYAIRVDVKLSSHDINSFACFQSTIERVESVKEIN